MNALSIQEHCVTLVAENKFGAKRGEGNEAYFGGSKGERGMEPGGN